MDQTVKCLGHNEYGQDQEPPFESMGPRGTGGFGSVDEVRVTLGPLEGKRFARKTIELRGNKRDRDVTYGTIKSETDILENIHHDHAVRLVATYLHDNRRQRRTTYGIIMDPIADYDLEKYFEYASDDENRDLITEWFGCLINGLAYLHRKGIRHRDIKPQNILIHGTKILFTDFGIAFQSMQKTVSSTITGKPRSRTMQYCAPEVEKGHSRSRPADVFSLGAVFLEMLVVYCNPDDLSRFREELQFDGQLSFAIHYKKALEWASKAIDQVDLRRSHQLSSIIFLCKKMMDSDPNNRPDAESLRACWHYQQFSVLPATQCQCDIGSRLLGHHVTDINQALLKAAENGHTLAAELLILNGADVNTQDDSGNTPLSYAKSNGHKSCASLFVEKGGKLAARRKGKKGCTHKTSIPCDLTYTELCCACADERPVSDSYECYIDGKGIGSTRERWLHYCPSCQNHYNSRTAG